MADFNKAVAAEVCKLGLNPKAADHKEPATDTDLTPTQRVLAAKGVTSLADLNRKQPMPTSVSDLWIPDIWLQTMREKQATFPSLLNSGVAVDNKITSKRGQRFFN